jgi:hypothetical protein
MFYGMVAECARHGGLRWVGRKVKVPTLSPRTRKDGDAGFVIRMAEAGRAASDRLLLLHRIRHGGPAQLIVVVNMD